MILVDTSVWVDHLRRSSSALVALLGQGQVATHAFVVGELALGSLKHRDRFLNALQSMPQTVVATDTEVLRFIDEMDLHSMGIGLVDVHLLASCRLNGGTLLWTSDKRLQAAASELALAWSPVL